MADQTAAASASNSQTENLMGTSSTTITIDRTDAAQSQEDTVQLKLRKPSDERKVKWSTETVDNEHMDKKKSKCCCIYKKPRAFGESSSEDDSDEDHCDHHGHSKKTRRNRSEYNDNDIEGGESGDILDIKNN